MSRPLENEMLKIDLKAAPKRTVPPQYGAAGAQGEEIFQSVRQPEGVSSTSGGSMGLDPGCQRKMQRYNHLQEK